jgi:prevent-host-death family protein
MCVPASAAVPNPPPLLHLVRKRRVFSAVVHCMTQQIRDLGPPEILPSITTEELRSNLSTILNRAAFGIMPVVITRRGRNIAAVISIDDLARLQLMRLRKDRMGREEVPTDPSQIGKALARSVEWELLDA